MVRIMIVLLVLGSGFPGWKVFEQREEISLYESAMAPGGQVEQDMTDPGRHKYTSRKKLKEQEGIKGT